MLIINMYRVLLKVDRLCLRIKETVELYIQIRKNQRQFAHCHNHTLVNGELSLTNTSQFFIYTKEPSFAVEIILVVGQTRKKGGVSEINLKNFDINSSHRIKLPILQIPIHNCHMYLDFVYMISSKAFEGNEMYSLQQLQNINHKQYLETISTQHSKLVNQKVRLHSQIQHLKMKNQSLQIQNNLMQKKQQVRVKQRENQIEQMEVQRGNSEGTLKRQNLKIAEIVDFIHQSKNQQLISQAEVIMNTKTTQHKTK